MLHVLCMVLSSILQLVMTACVYVCVCVHTFVFVLKRAEHWSAVGMVNRCSQ